MAKPIKARLLVAHSLGLLVMKANDVVIGEPALIKHLVKHGIADDDKAAVEYAESQGAVAIDYVDPAELAKLEAEAAAEKATKVAELKDAITVIQQKIDGLSADSAEKKTFEAELATKKDELAKLEAA